MFIHTNIVPVTGTYVAIAMASQGGYRDYYYKIEIVCLEIKAQAT